MIGYVVGGWAACFGLIVIYAWRTLRRGRVLARTLPAGEKTWR